MMGLAYTFAPDPPRPGEDGGAEGPGAAMTPRANVPAGGRRSFGGFIGRVSLGRVSLGRLSLTRRPSMVAEEDEFPRLLPGSLSPLKRMAETAGEIARNLAGIVKKDGDESPALQPSSPKRSVSFACRRIQGQLSEAMDHLPDSDPDEKGNGAAAAGRPPASQAAASSQAPPTNAFGMPPVAEPAPNSSWTEEQPGNGIWKKEGQEEPPMPPRQSLSPPRARPNINYMGSPKKQNPTGAGSSSDAPQAAAITTAPPPEILFNAAAEPPVTEAVYSPSRILDLREGNPAASPASTIPDSVPVAASPAAPQVADPVGLDFSMGEYVEIHNLKGAWELNGRKGHIVAFVPENGRYGVRLQGEVEPKALKPENLRKCGAEPPARPREELVVEEKKQDGPLPRDVFRPFPEPVAAPVTTTGLIDPHGPEEDEEEDEEEEDETEEEDEDDEEDEESNTYNTVEVREQAPSRTLSPVRPRMGSSPVTTPRPADNARSPPGMASAAYASAPAASTPDVEPEQQQGGGWGPFGLIRRAVGKIGEVIIG